MKRRRGWVPWLQYVCVRLAIMVLDMFPVDLNLRTARWFGRLWWRALPRHRTRACEHIRKAYGDELSEAEVQRIALASMQQMVMLAVEMAQVPRLLNERNWTRHVRLVNFSDALRVLLEGQGGILLTGHYGNWELCGYLLALIGFENAAIMRPLDNAYLNDYLVSVRSRHGLRLLHKKGVIASAEEVIRSGVMLGFIADQDAGRKGLFVDFFGAPASTYKSIGLLAMATERPIIVGYCRRLSERFDYELGVQRVIHPHEWQAQDDPLRWITQEYTSQLEQIVRTDPTQYLWIHRRWKSVPRQRPVQLVSSGDSGGTVSRSEAVEGCRDVVRDR